MTASRGAPLGLLLFVCACGAPSEPTCQPGAACTDNPGAPCRVGAQQCDMSPSCADAAPLSAGSACGSGRVCDGAGACIACSEGMACSTNPSECVEGKISCAGGASACVDGAPRTAGAPCGQAQRCDGLGLCLAPACDDGLKNGPESDVDCGGSCPKCDDQKACALSADCNSGVCTASVCQAPLCTDGVTNGSETDLDCGGSCAAKCDDARHCTANGDCKSGVCTGNVCQASACSDHVQNGTESDVDCGGSCPQKCDDLRHCALPPDCRSGVCTSNVCVASSCSDGVQNGSETDLDCGGACPQGCANQQHCAMGGDCQSGVCSGNACQTPTCVDGVKNGAETDVDCGGGTCGPCAESKGCLAAADCLSSVCTSNVCQVPTCMDGAQNGAETDKDCGGGTCGRCTTGKKCAGAADCTSGVCSASHVCSAASCSDGVKNGSEDAVDCGGGCPLSCDPSLYATPVDPTIATDLFDSNAFLYSGPNAIQKGVTATFNPLRFTILRGRVVDTGQQPLPGVTVRIAGHPEWGYTLSRADGMYDFCVDGGGQLTVTYDAPGRLPAERHVDAVWHDFVPVADVALVQLDPNPNPISFTAPMSVARGSVVTDKDGTRQATVFFPQGTVATMLFLDGGSSVLPTATVRITEYTVGDAGEQAMPGELPPTSAYTYASEFSVDEAMSAGAWRVNFSQNVIGYLDNFIQMPVGMAVPQGTYDKRYGAWTPEADGRVVKIVSTTGGLADLDLDGGNVAAPLAVLADAGISDAERAQLASLYAPGKTLWRMPMSHFTPQDWNWPYGFPNGATPPNAPKPGIDGPQDPCKKRGCEIEVQNEVVGENVPIQGTPFQLHYSSDRVIGRDAARTVDVQITSTTINPLVKDVAVSFAIAGQYAEYHFGASPPAHYVWTWDGRDAYGRRLQGPQHGVMRVGYAYQAIYHGADITAGAGGGGSFGAFGTVEAAKGSRGLIWVWQTQKMTLMGKGGLDYRGLGFGGWSLSEQHLYDSTERTLYLGSGGQRTRDRFGSMIKTVLTGAPIEDMVPAPDGTFYMIWGGSHQLRRYDPATGATTVLVGSGVSGRIQLARDGTLYNAHDYGLERLWPIRQTLIPFNTLPMIPDSFAIKADGTLLLGGGNCNASLSLLTYLPNAAKVSTSLFNQTPGACLWDMATTPNGDVLYGGRGAIQRALTDGSHKVFAGTGTVCSFCTAYFGDGVPANTAGLSDSLRFIVGGDGTAYLSDTCSIRTVDTAGIIRTIAGNGNCSVGNTADNIAARDARVNGSRAIALHPNGDLYFVETTTNLLRKITPALPGYTRQDTFMPDDDGTHVFHFDAKGRHIETLDAVTQLPLQKLGYDAAGRVVSMTDPDGNMTTIARDASGNATAITAPGGQVTTLSYDAQGYLQTVTDAAGRTRTFGYVGSGLLSNETFGGATHSFAYDADGRLLTVQDPTGVMKAITRSRVNATSTWGFIIDGGTTTSYDVQDLPAGGAIRRIHDGAGGLTTSNEPFGGATSLIQPDGTQLASQQAPDPRWNMLAPVLASQTLSLPDAGTVLSETFARSVTLSQPTNPLSVATITDTATGPAGTFTSAWNGTTRRLTKTTPAGRVGTTDFDAKGHLIREVPDPALTPLVSSYDPSGLLLQLAQGSTTMSLGYDAKRRLTSKTDAAGRVATFEYDAADNPTAIVNPSGRRYELGYDARGNRITVRMPSLAVHSLTYDALDRVTSYTPPGGQPMTVTYEANGNAAQATLADGRVVSSIYDSGERPTQITSPEANVDISYVGATSNIAVMARTPTAGPAQASSFTYDGSRLLKIVMSGAASGTYAFVFDNNNRTVGVSLDGAPLSARGRDADGLMTSAGPYSITRGGPMGLASQLGDAAGAVTLTYDSSARQTGRQLAVGGAASFQETLAFDSLGRIASKTETISGTAHAFAYAYDLDGQLLQVSRDGTAVETYTYDANGNRTSRKSGAAATENATYDEQDQLLTAGGAAYAFNTAGQLTARGGDTYVMGSQGELLSATVGGTSVSYAYDAIGRRVARTVQGATTQYLYADSSYRPAHSRDGAGVLSEYFYDEAGMLFAVIRGGTRYFVATDHVGTPRQVVDEAGVVQMTVEYDAFGNVVSGDPETFDLPQGFAGGLRDPVTHLVRFGVREYEPASGRWTSRDPSLFDTGQLNLFVYAGNDPIDDRDPTGLEGQPTQQLSVQQWVGYFESVGDSRFIGAYGESDQYRDLHDPANELENLIDASHYLYARDELVPNYGVVGATVMAIVYSEAKAAASLPLVGGVASRIVSGAGSGGSFSRFTPRQFVWMMRGIAAGAVKSWLATFCRKR